MDQVARLGSQVIATSLERDESLFPAGPQVFHVEQGELRLAADA